MTETAAIDPFVLFGDPNVWRRPQPAYEAMRAAGVVISRDGMNMVTSREAVDEVLRHPELFSSAHAADLQNLRPLIPLQIDPPDHKKFRKLLDPLFAPQRMKLLEDDVARLVHERIDAFGDRREVDFATEFSVPLPSQIFLTMFGLPLDDLPSFLAMKDGIIRPHVVVGEPGDKAVEHQRVTALSIYDYFERAIDERGSERRADLLSHFLDAEVDGDRLSREDILDICFLLLIAGLDTVSASLDCFFTYLAEHPERRRELVAEPELIPTAIEELLRYETPVVVVPRTATRDVEVAGVTIKEGEHVLAMLASANTDPDDVAHAGEVDWHREANKHLAFGGGVHRCLGSHLARMELRVAMREWHARIPDYRLAPDADLVFSLGVRSVESLPLILGEPL